MQFTPISSSSPANQPIKNENPVQYYLAKTSSAQLVVNKVQQRDFNDAVTKAVKEILSKVNPPNGTPDGLLAKLELSEKNNDDFPRQILNDMHSVLDPASSKTLKTAGFDTVNVWNAQDEKPKLTALIQYAHRNNLFPGKPDTGGASAINSTEPDIGSSSADTAIVLTTTSTTVITTTTTTTQHTSPNPNSSIPENANAVKSSEKVASGLPHPKKEITNNSDNSSLATQSAKKLTETKGKTVPSPVFPLLIKFENLEKIPYCASLNAEPTYLSPEEFKTQFGFSYSESIFVLNERLKSQFEHASAAENVQRRTIPEGSVNHPCTSVAIYDTGSPALGSGCKAIKDISMGEFVMAYSGVISDYASANQASLYAMEVPGGMCIDSGEVGNLARFLNHAPSGHEMLKWSIRETEMKNWTLLGDSKLNRERTKLLDEDRYIRHIIDQRDQSSDLDFASLIEFENSEVKSELVTANLIQLEACIKGAPVLAIVAACDIKKGEILSVDYGVEYWKSLQKEPLYFKKNGEVITSDYVRKSGATSVPQNKSDAEVTQEAKTQYSLGVAAYKQKEYHKAFQHITQAIDIFSHVPDKNISPLVECYSTMASLFRELALEKDFFFFCNKAIELASTHPKKNSLTEPVLKKYHEYLSKKFSGEKNAKEYTLAFLNTGAQLLEADQAYLSIATFEYLKKLGRMVTPLGYTFLGRAHATVGNRSEAIAAMEEAKSLSIRFYGSTSPEVQERTKEINEYKTSLSESKNSD